MGQQTFDGIEPLELPERGVTRAVPLLNTAALDAKIVDEPQQIDAAAVRSEAPPKPKKLAPLVGPPDKNEPALPFRDDELDVKYLTTVQVSAVFLLYIITFLIFSITVFGASVSEIGIGAFKIAGLSRDIVLGSLGLAAIGLTTISVLAAAPIARRIAPARSRSVRYIWRRLVRAALTAALLFFPLVAIQHTYMHSWHVAKSIVVVTYNSLTLPPFETTTTPTKKR